jgi:Zn-dependent protease
MSMMARRVENGALRLGKVFRIDVFVHWSWAVVAIIEVETRKSAYEAQLFNVLEYLALFGCVFCHEVGHALACRSVGGTAERIMLWPLGGVAYVKPPVRPGALLWSIVAGPLVNVAFVVLLVPLVIASRVLHLSHDVSHFVLAMATINVVLFCFNVLPIYPLDGGQILQALLWFVVGRAKSLMVVSMIGFVVAVAVFVIALVNGSIWFSVMSLFAGLRAFAGMRQAKVLATIASAERRTGFSCPTCHSEPPVGAFWTCACKNAFDTFAAQGRCPACQRSFTHTTCTECHALAPHRQFYPYGMREEPLR